MAQECLTTEVSDNSAHKFFNQWHRIAVPRILKNENSWEGYKTPVVEKFVGGVATRTYTHSIANQSANSDTRSGNLRLRYERLLHLATDIGCHLARSSKLYIGSSCTFCVPGVEGWRCDRPWQLVLLWSLLVPMLRSGNKLILWDAHRIPCDPWNFSWAGRAGGHVAQGSCLLVHCQ